MASAVSICNQALLFLGASPIVSFEDNEIGQACEVLYPEARDAMLSEQIWQFATERRTFSAKSEISWGADNKFLIPNDILLVHRVYSDPDSSSHGRDQVRDWRIESGHVVANTDVIYAHVVIKVTDENKMPAYFRQALAARMARDLAMPITHNENMLQAMSNLYERKLDEAISADARQGTTEQYEEGRLIKARY